MVRTMLPKVIVILGPTASGKTSLALDLARRFNGEIISADSRQVYKLMDVGTAKPKGCWRSVDGKMLYMVEEIPHYLVDTIFPDQPFSLADFKTQALMSIHDIVKRGKVPFLVGGTGLYIWSIIDNLSLATTPPQAELRVELETKTLSELIDLLEKKDPESLSVVDKKNRRRVIRALEIVLSTGRSLREQRTVGELLGNFMQIGLTVPKDVLLSRIKKRIEEQFEDGFVEEVRSLLAAGYTFNLPSMSSLGYPQIGSYIRQECSLDEAKVLLNQVTWQYAKRQMTWFRRDKKIEWFESEAEKNLEEKIKTFLA